MISARTSHKIAGFPTLYPDELFYSACARYSDRVRYRYVSSLRLELFGSVSFTPSILFANHLDHFLAALAEEHYLDFETIINNHTLLPFYTPFIQQDRVDKAYKVVKGSNIWSVSVLLGSNTGFKGSPERLRYCASCVQQDRKMLGETYWHRIHQIPGVKVCAFHQIPLSLSSMVIREGGVQLREFFPAERTIPQKVHLPTIEPTIVYPILVRLARDAYSLLNLGVSADLERIHMRYISILAKMGFIATSGKLRASDLTSSFIDYFSESVLSLIGCSINTNQKKNWLTKMIHMQVRAFHPIYHLLLIQFLQHTIDSFFSHIPIEMPSGKDLVNRSFNQIVIGNATNEDLRRKHREIWLEALQKYPEESITHLRKHYETSYSWLRLNDRQWWLENKPVLKQITIDPWSSRGDMNWTEIDRDLETRIRIAVKKIREKIPPVQITRTEIIREIGEANRIRYKNKKLLCTQAALHELLEPRDAFIIRKIWYTKNLYLMERKMPLRNEFVLRAGAQNLVRLPQVSTNVDAALKELTGTFK